MNIIGGQYEQRWPESERNAIKSNELSYNQRIMVGTFLFGNLRDSDLVLAAVLPQLGSERQVQVQLAAERIPRACRVARG